MSLKVDFDKSYINTRQKRKVLTDALLVSECIPLKSIYKMNCPKTGNHLLKRTETENRYL
jgi:hypothetical protein